MAGDRLTVVRPPAVYGPGDRETLTLFQAAQRLPALPLLGGPDARIALIHAQDAAAQIAALAARPAAGALHALSDDRPEGYGWREIMQAAAASVGRQARPVRLPAALVMAAGAAAAVAGRLTGRVPMLSPGKARELLHGDWSVHESERATGLPEVRFNLEEGLADTVNWYRREGWL